MPRVGRLDYQGALQHVIARGVARQAIFLDRTDYRSFISRLGRVLRTSNTACFAWALMPNHLHLILQTGEIGLGHVMHRLLLGYSVWFNHRHGRAGHLFQNRYKSLLCESEAYFLDLIRYVHLNPLKGHVVASLEELASHPWCGHGVILGRRRISWQDTDTVLGRFGTESGEAVDGYIQFIREGASQLENNSLEGGGSPRDRLRLEKYSLGKQLAPVGSGDRRILGDVTFVRSVIRRTRVEDRRRHGASRRLSVDQVIERAAEIAGITPAEVAGTSKLASRVIARDLACKWLVDELGLPGVVVERLLGLSSSVVSRSVVRGRVKVAEQGLSLCAPRTRE